MAKGRPKKSSNDDSCFQCFKTNKHCDEILELLATLSSYHVLTENRKSTKYDRKLTEIQQLLMSEDLDKNHIFFLRNQKIDLKIIDGTVIDTTNYPMIEMIEATQFSESETLKGILNKYLFKTLNFQTIVNLIGILELYLITLNCEEPQLPLIIQNIRSNSQQFKYLLSWEKLQQLTEKERYEQKMENLKIQQKAIQKPKKDKGKVQKKHEEFLNQREKQMKKENDKGCLCFLIENLMGKFHDMRNDELVAF